MDIIEKIKMEEGDKSKMYKCPAGKWTIGAGINLEQQRMPEEVFYLWTRKLSKLSNEYGVAFLMREYSGIEEFKSVAQLQDVQDRGMPQEVRDLWLETIVARLDTDLLSQAPMYFSAFTGDGGDDDLVIFDMAYQMGVNGLLKFEKMLAAIDEEDYETAADELLDSNYARQTPERANRNADLLRGCA